MRPGFLKFFWTALFLCVLVFAPAVSFSNGISIEIRGEFSQGSVLFARVSGVSANASGTIGFLEKEFDMTNRSGALEATLPVPLDLAPGSYQVVASVVSDGVEERLSRTVSVSAKNYGVQRLALSGSQLALYDDPQADRDNDAILEALGRCSEDAVSWTSKFTRPVDGRVSTQFGLRRYYGDDPEPEFHKGVDIAGYVGKRVVAPQNGVVLMTGEDLVLHGGVVVLSHGRGVGTIYLHLDSVCVSVGDRVRQGDVIGIMGEKGVATGPHLHWAAYSQGIPVSPWQLVTLPASWLDE